MRTYVGTIDWNDGRASVVIKDGTAPPEPSEVVELLDDLAELTRTGSLGGPSPAPERLHRLLQRKRELSERITAAASNGRALPHLGVHSPDGFAWGYSGSGPADLAHAILQRELAVDVPSDVYIAFRDDVVAQLPEAAFELPVVEVWDWIRANRDLVDRRVFGVETQEPVLAITDQHGAVEAEPLTLTAPTASKLIEACEAAWSDIRAQHPELPEVVIVLGTGVERGRLVKLGHWWGERWIADGQTCGEVLLAGEALHLQPKEVFEILLHEAAHGINAARGVKDTSRGGRYHNERFANTAREVGLEVQPMPPYGMAHTELTEATEERYSASIERVGETMRIARQLQGIRGIGVEKGQEVQGQLGGTAAGAGGNERSRNAPAASCSCGRRMRMAPSVMAKGPVVCGACGSEFATDAEVRSTPAPDEVAPDQGVIDDTFQARRRDALRAEQDERLRQGLVEDSQRITSALDGQELSEGTTAALAARQERIGSALGQMDGAPVRSADESAERRLERWHEAFGTLREEPMAAADDWELRVLTVQARELLRHEGVIRGPGLDLGPLAVAVAVGDRVVVREEVADGPPVGTLGSVVSVDPGRHVAGVDFRTWGEVEVASDSSLAAAIVHDYATLEPVRDLGAQAALDHELQRGLALEPGP